MYSLYIQIAKGHYRRILTSNKPLDAHNYQFACRVEYHA
jgi:hypothetical protein